MTRSLPSASLNPFWTGYRCSICDRAYGPDWRGFVCSDCGPDGILDAQYDYASIATILAQGTPFATRDLGGMWRFSPLLPLTPLARHAAWSLGGTPLLAAPRLGEQLGVQHLWLKDDTCLPSASLKDRASAMALVDAARLKVKHIGCASTGNAAASLATLAARAGIACTIFVPSGAPVAKLAQLLLHGSRVVRVDGDYDAAYELSLRELAIHGWYSRNCAHNPLLVEGKKTAALEIALDLDWQTPDAIYVPVGDGCIISAVAKAFAELQEIGLCQQLPRVYGVQAAGAAPIARAWQAAGESAPTLPPRDILAAVTPHTPHTCADSIAVGVPRNRVKAWRGVAKTGGGFLTVTDEEILAAVALLARAAGLFAEPSAAAGLAGLIKAKGEGLIEADERIVVLVTGHGLKDPTCALAGVELPDPVSPDSHLQF